MLYFLFFALLVLLLIFLVVKRAKKYRYNASHSYSYLLEENLLTKTKIEDSTLIVPNNFHEFDTLFLKIELGFSPLSYIFKPCIKIENTKHYFEYGAKGSRYLNLSHIKNKTLTLELNTLKIASNVVSIYGYKNDIDIKQKILILAPHADDAEIAAFGLYKSAQDVTIVTTTASEEGICNHCDIYKNDKTKQALKKAELRAFDALSVPLLGNVPIQNSLALGYFGGTLKWMSEHKDANASSHIEGIKSMDDFRKVSHANIALPLCVKPNYTSFLNDLQEIIEQLKPDFILTPHPAIDSHSDHKQTTYALLDILKDTNHICKLLLYTNHLKHSETYPIGEMHSTITLPPNREDFYFDSVFSFELEKDLQIDKFFALEAIHDLRDSLLVISIKKSFKHLNKLLRRKVTGKDKSYFKRAVRANELFFVVESENIDKLRDI